MFYHICFKDGNIQYFKQTFLVCFLRYMFIGFCIFLLIIWFVFTRPKILFHTNVTCTFRIIDKLNNYDEGQKQTIRAGIFDKMKKHHDTKQLYYMIMYITTSIMNLILVVLFSYLLLKFGSLHLQKTYPFGIFLLFFTGYVFENLFDFSHHFRSENIINRYIQLTEENTRDALIEGFLNEVLTKKFIIFICLTISVFIIIAHYSREISSIKEYDIIIICNKSVLNLDKFLWINPKLFNKSDSTIYGNYSVEIPREIVLTILDHNRIKGDNHAKFYVKKSDKKTLICVFGDGSVMYFNIKLW